MPDYDDPYGNDDDDDQDQTPRNEDPIQKLRQQNRSLNKDLKTERQKLAELEAFKATIEAERKEAALAAIATDAGIRPEHARLFAQLRPEADPTREEVLAFAKEYGLVAPATEVNAAAATAQGSFKPVEVGGTSPVHGKYTREEWAALGEAQDPEYELAWQEGRVESLEEQDLRLKTGIDQDNLANQIAGLIRDHR